ncbi:MAG: cobalamin biosynthesis protein CobD, partial [Cellulosilyticum sp.]|nr:cobalamin biosynthesis protein CobD [Cellulosilyticum sp.]
MIYHMIAFLLGFIMDLILGDPYWLPHPIRLIGNLISVLERRLNGRKNPLDDGKLLVFIVLLSTGIISGVILVGAYFIHQYLGCLIEIIMTYQILACRCLKVESMKVYYALKNGTLQEAQKAVSMIVGRDTLVLDKIGITKATVETVAENTSDGVIAPMIYLAIGGPILGFLYKAVNTMDSMVGYKNERYLYFGRAAAKLDDRMNFLPSRISAYLMILASFLLGKV